MTLDDIKARCDVAGKCWFWTGPVDTYGAPLVYAEHRKMRPARRVARALADGEPIPAGMVVIAKCGNQLCVSPHCSKCATTRQKARLAAKRGAYINPVRDAKAQLRRREKSWITEELVEQIRLAPGPASRIAAETKVSVSHVKAIRRGASRQPLGSPWAGLGAR